MLLEVRIVGTVGKDPEVREVKGGKKVASFSVATKPGKDQTVWVKVTAWDKQAENIEKFVKAKMKVMCTGTLQLDENGKPRTYTDSSGAVKSSGVEMTAFQTLFLTKPEVTDAPTATAQDLFLAGGEIDFSLDDDDGEVVPF